MFPFFDGDLLVASEAAGHVLRLRLSPRTGDAPVAMGYLLEDAPLRVRRVVGVPDGTFHVLTSSAVGRVVPVM